MKKEIYTCDYCGEDFLPDKSGFADEEPYYGIEIMVREFEDRECDMVAFDLCLRCKRNLLNTLEKQHGD